MKKILIIPSSSIYWKPSKLEIYIRRRINSFIGRFLPKYSKLMSIPKKFRQPSFLDRLGLRYNNVPVPGNDLAWWGSFSSFTGYESYIVGKPNPIYFDSNFKGEGADRWPVFYKFKPFRLLNCDQALKKINDFSFIFVSSKYHFKFHKIIMLAKENHKKIIYFDAFDDDQIYKFGKKVLLIPPSGFYLQFKQDIPLDVKSERTYALTPVPCNRDTKILKPYTLKHLKKKTIPIFFSGAFRKNIIREERIKIAERLKHNFPNSIIHVNQKKLSNDDYEKGLSNAYFHLSPSGRVWNSFRHTLSPSLGAIAIIPEPDCFQGIVNFEDMINCILYSPKNILNDKRSKNEIEKLSMKIKYLIDNPKEYLKILNNSIKQIHNKSTRVQASKYILSKLND